MNNVCYLARNAVLRCVRDVSHFKAIPPTELTIPGDAEKVILFDPYKTTVRYIAKAPKKHGVTETLTEYLINCVGMRLNAFAFSQSRLGKLRSSEGTYDLRFLSVFFHSGDERLTHGIQLFSTFYSNEELSEFEKGRKERNLYTLENIKAAIELAYPSNAEDLIRDFIGMCLFDALIGNQDRHAKNWGFVEPVRRHTKAETRFAPVFDSARGFFWNVPDSGLSKFLKSESIEKYHKLGTPQISAASAPHANHFELVRIMWSLFRDERDYMRSVLRKAAGIEVREILKQRVFKVGLSTLRCHLIDTCYRSRLKHLREIIQ